MDWIMEIAEQASDLVVERVTRSMVRYPGLSVEKVYDEIARTSKLGPMTDELSRMKLGIA